MSLPPSGQAPRPAQGAPLRAAEGVRHEGGRQASTDSGELTGWRLPTRVLRLIGRHEGLEHALRQRGIDLVGIDGALRTGELGLMPITASTPLPDLERWLGPGAQAVPVLIHADSIALAPPVSRCGSDLALLFAHNSGCAGPPSPELLATAAERIEASLCGGTPWPRVQLRRQGSRALASGWPASAADIMAASAADPALPSGLGSRMWQPSQACAAAHLYAPRLQSQLLRHGFEGSSELAQALLPLLASVLMDRDECGLSLRPALSIHGAAGSTVFELQLQEGIVVASETWAHGLVSDARLQLSCSVEHAARSHRFGLLGRSLGWIEAGEALGKLRDAAAALGFGVRESAAVRHAASPASSLAQSEHISGQDLAWCCSLSTQQGTAAPAQVSPALSARPSSHHFLRQGPDPAGLVPLLEALRPPTLEPGISVLLVHRTRGDRLTRQVYRSRTRRWEALDTLDLGQSDSDPSPAYADAPGNRIYLLSPLPGEQPGESVDGYLRRARDAGEWSRRLRQHLHTHGLTGYRLGRFDSAELAGALPALRTSRDHVLSALAVGIEAPDELVAGR